VHAKGLSTCEKTDSSSVFLPIPLFYVFFASFYQADVQMTPEQTPVNRNDLWNTRDIKFAYLRSQLVLECTGKYARNVYGTMNRIFPPNVEAEIERNCPVPFPLRFEESENKRDTYGCMFWENLSEIRVTIAQAASVIPMTPYETDQNQSLATYFHLSAFVVFALL